MTEQQSSAHHENKNTDQAESAPAKPLTSAVKSQESQVKAAQTSQQPSIPLSKLALLALLLSLTAIAALGYGYYWWQQQHSHFQQQLLTQTNQQFQALKAENEQRLTAQQRQFEQQLAQLNAEVSAENQATIEQLRRTIKRLSATQPTDWLLHEAEYLVRVAGRTLWLEKDVTAAIVLLVDADERLARLNDAKYLSLRQLLHQDIESLKLLPKLDTDRAVLSLMALAEQVDKLPLAYKLKLDETKPDLELSNNTDDWQENLAKSWQRFADNFITIRRRTDSVEALLSPEQQQNLLANLKLKIQQVQWAAIKQKEDLYQQSLLAVEAWLKKYFDLEAEVTQLFLAQLHAVKNATISVDYPSEFSAAKPLRALVSGTDFSRILVEESAISAQTSSSDTSVKPSSEPDLSEPEASSQQASPEAKIPEQTLTEPESPDVNNGLEPEVKPEAEDKKVSEVEAI